MFTALDKLGARKKVSGGAAGLYADALEVGELTEHAWNYYGDALTDVLPALGTHKAMTDHEIQTMFGPTPRDLFRVHDWRNDVVTLGEVPGEFVREVSEGKVDYPWPAQVNKLLRDGGHDLILSIGQIVPHEVVGMAGYNKNIFVGTGGVMGIHRSALSGRGVRHGAHDGTRGYSGAAGAELCERALCAGTCRLCTCRRW